MIFIFQSFFRLANQKLRQKSISKIQWKSFRRYELLIRLRRSGTTRRCLHASRVSLINVNQVISFCNFVFASLSRLFFRLQQQSQEGKFGGLKGWMFCSMFYCHRIKNLNFQYFDFITLLNVSWMFFNRILSTFPWKRSLFHIECFSMFFNVSE